MNFWVELLLLVSTENLICVCVLVLVMYAVLSLASPHYSVFKYDHVILLTY